VLYFRRTLAITAVLIVSIEAAADLVYESDFQSGVTTHWSSSDLSTDELGKVVLGLFKQETISLTLPAQPTGEYGITFDFFNFNTWDGAEGDSFEFQINGTTSIDATFDNLASFVDLQTYSISTPLGGGPFPTGTDNTGMDLLKHTGADASRIGNFRYTPSFTFTHSGGDMTFTFVGKIDQPSVSNALNPLPAPLSTDKCHSQRMVRTKPLLCANEIEVTREPTQVDRPVIEGLCTIDHGEAACFPESSEDSFNRQSHAQVTDITQEDRVTTALLVRRYD